MMHSFLHKCEPSWMFICQQLDGTQDTSGGAGSSHMAEAQRARDKAAEITAMLGSFAGELFPGPALLNRPAATGVQASLPDRLPQRPQAFDLQNMFSSTARRSVQSSVRGSQGISRPLQRTSAAAQSPPQPAAQQARLSADTGAAPPAPQPSIDQRLDPACMPKQ
jgi:hypothetical protein